MAFHEILSELSWTMPAHQVLELLAYAAGFQLYLWLRRRWARGPVPSPEQTAWIIVGVIFGALIGAKVLAWAESFPSYWAHRADWRVLIGGKTIVGALLGGWLGVELAKRRLGIGHPSGDIYVFPLILGMCIGRIGCFLAGLADNTFGLPTALPWGVDFGDGIRRHPAQLYELGFLLFMGGVFAWRMRTGRQAGCMFSQFMFGYLAFRFVIEFIKPREMILGNGLSAIQLAALAGLVYAVFHWNDQCCGKPALVCANKPPDVHAARGPQFFELTNSLCPMCLRKIEAKVVIEDGGVFLNKFCPDHGQYRVLIADDAAYWEQSRAIYKPPTPPLRRNTSMEHGCPWDCGLCPDHEQHSCLAVVEITGRCDLKCPICYASCSPDGQHRSLQQVERMLDAVIGNEGQANLVQISGGEPTLHPDLFAILDAAKRRPIRHLMLPTNGRRIAEDPDLVKRLASYMPGFEVYLQFDSLRPATLRQLRGDDLSGMRLKAIDMLNRFRLSTTLVVTLKKGVNDQEIGEILEFATQQPCVRGVTFQPIQAAGRLDGFNAATDRLTLTEVRRRILEQHRLFTPQDLVPVPCHTDAIAMGYAVRRGKTLVPLSKLIDPRRLTEVGGNTICYEQDPALRQNLRQLYSVSASPVSAAEDMDSLCCRPDQAALPPIKYDQVFRVIILQFMDAWSMDLRSLKRSCVHIVHPDGRLIPFDTYNLLYRGDLTKSPRRSLNTETCNLEPR